VELILRVNSSSNQSSYQDGDIVAAFSMESIYMCHAQNKCHLRHFPLDTVTGLRPNNSLIMKFKEKTNTYKFQRLNSNDVSRTNLITGEQDIISSVPNENGEYINIYHFLSRKLQNPRHCVFGSRGSEIWYGLRRRDIDIDSIWNDIETHTDYLKSDHIFWPLSEIEQREFLSINCCKHTCEEHEHEHDHNDAACLTCSCSCDLSECSRQDAADATAGVYNSINELIAKRRHQVPYWDLSSTLSINVDDVRNINKVVDLRKQLDLRPSHEVLSLDKVHAGIIVEP